MGESESGAQGRSGQGRPDLTLAIVAIKFVVYYAIGQTVAWLLAFSGRMNPLLAWMASGLTVCANATGVVATQVGNQVMLAERTLRIDPDCTGISLMLVYAALVLAYPLGWKRRLLALALGLPVLIAVNSLRLLAVAQLSGRLDPEAFMFAHDYLFKVGMVAVVVGLWAVFLLSARRSNA